MVFPVVMSQMLNWASDWQIRYLADVSNTLGVYGRLCILLPWCVKFFTFNIVVSTVESAKKICFIHKYVLNVKLGFSLIY